MPQMLKYKTDNSLYLRFSKSESVGLPADKAWKKEAPPEPPTSLSLHAQFLDAYGIIIM